MNIAVLGGTGNQGKGLAMRFALAGHQVWVGSRTREKAQEAVAQMQAELDRPVALRAGDNAEASRQADIVFLTVPHPHELPTVNALKGQLNGKILVDVSVPLTSYKPPRAELPPQGSAAEAIQQALGPHVPVVAAFKTTSAYALQQIAAPLRSDEPVCGDHPEANAKVRSLIEQIGARALDAGSLRNARALELLTALLITLDQRYKKRDAGLKFPGL